ncbi:MAG: dTMP kinase [Acidobacteriota bacterium]|nr:dTMP kinase [Acidobacteriota bacterium]
MSGIFLTFEGLDGSGKTTQLRLLADALTRRGFDVLATREPGGTILGKRIRELILEVEDAPAPLAELLLFAADRAQHLETLVKPALAAGKIVISDRYADATAAYQGAGRGFPADKIRRTIELATDNFKPDLTLFFDLPTEKALARANSRPGELNRLDKETIDFFDSVRCAYLEIATAEPKRFRVIEASGSINEIHEQTLQIVTQFLESRNRK